MLSFFLCLIADCSSNLLGRRILRCEPFYPTSFSVGVKDLLRGLLAKDAKRRLGCGRNGVEDIKQHQWFDGLDWACLKSKQMSPPFVPVIRDELDVSNFSEEFTRQTPTDSPAVVPSLSDKDIFRVDRNVCLSHRASKLKAALCTGLLICGSSCSL